MSTSVTISIDEELDQWLEEKARHIGISKTDFIETQLDAARREIELKPWLALAGIIKDAPPDLSTRKGFDRDGNR